MTFNQLLKKERSKKKNKTKTPRLESCPQKRGICEKVFTVAPKKPNSAVRKVVRVWLPSTLTKTHAYIPGIGHKLQKFSTVLIRGGRTRDLPGMYYKVIRGKYDAKPVWLRRRSISKYGVRNYYMFKKKKRWKQKI